MTATEIRNRPPSPAEEAFGKAWTAYLQEFLRPLNKAILEQIKPPKLK